MSGSDDKDNSPSPTTSPISYPPGSTTKPFANFNKLQKEAAEDIDTTETKLEMYRKATETTARLERLETFMKNQQQVQLGMQKQQADFQKQQAIFMQQVLQQMGPTTDTQTTDKQTKQMKNKQTTQFTQIKQTKQTKNTQKTKEER